MKGLILKDILTLKSTFKMLIIYIAVFALVFLRSGTPEVLTGVVTIMLVTLTISTFSYDEQSKWDSFQLSLPVSRTGIVLSKYLFAVIMGVVGFTVSLILNIGANALQSLPLVTAETFIVGGALVLVGLILVSCLLPFLFKFGAEKARIMLFIIIGIPSALIAVISMTDFTLDPDFFINPPMWLGFAAVALIILIFTVSIFSSIRIYSRKEI